ncbi:scm-like with four MBT domains protein 2 isoform X2 [Lycorma delicatula]
MKVEVQDSLNPVHFWIATIIESVGGRLLLRYDSPDSTSDRDFWLFYLSHRIFPIGSVESKSSRWKFKKPSCFIDSRHSDSEWEAVLEMAKEEVRRLPSLDVFQKSENEKIPLHNLSLGLKLEAVHPQNRAEICPASITKIFDDKNFLVTVDDMTQNIEEADDNNDLTWLSCLADPYIFPHGWAKSHNLKLTHPRGWISAEEEFDWDEYLEITKSSPALFTKLYSKNIAVDSGFEVGMKLEVVNPDNEHQICAATIANVTEHLIWIHLDSNDCFQPSVIFSLDSLEMFPVGWCEMNNYSLKPPQSYHPSQTLSSSQSSENASSVTNESETSNVKSEDCKDKQKDSSKSNGESRGSFWCPKIYFNHKCFSGPFLSKGKLAQLPKAVGPGPVTLVMKEVLSMLISVAYISSRVLRELQCKSKPHPGMHLEVLKAKYKSNAYRASVEIVTSADKVSDFCKDVCRKLQVCPYLFGPVAVGEKSCPENCSTLSKTRFCKNRTTGSSNDNSNSNNSSNLIKKIVVNPGVDSSTLPSSRNSNRLFTWPRRKRGLEKDYFSGFGKDLDDNSSSSGKRVRYETRGVKLPNFGLKKPNGTNISSNGSNNNNNNSSSISVRSQNHHHSPTGSECSSISSSMNENSSSLHQPPLKKKRGRHSKAKKEELRKAAELASDARMDDSLYQVDSNPLLWTVEDVYDYLRSTDDCDVLANLLKEEEFDGKSFMLLNLPSCLDSLKLNLKTALSLCRHVEAVKYTFFCKYVIPTTSNQQIDEPSN